MTQHIMGYTFKNRDLNAMLNIMKITQTPKIKTLIFKLAPPPKKYLPNNIYALRQHLQEGDFPKRTGWDAFLVHLKASLLESNKLSSDLVPGLVHLPIGALPDLLKLLILVHGGPIQSIAEII